MNKVTSLLQTAALLVTTQMAEWSLLHDTKTWPLLGWPVVQPWGGGSMRGLIYSLNTKRRMMRTIVEAAMTRMHIILWFFFWYVSAFCSCCRPC